MARPTQPGDPHDLDAVSIEISDTQSHLNVPASWLDGLIRHVLTAEGIERGSISLALVDDATIQILNRRHLDHDWPTDVISFVLSEPEEPDLTGELVVSAEMADRTAREFEADPRAELALYVVHGLLHLCGYDDLNAEEAALMRRREAEHLAREGLPNTFDRAFGRPEGLGPGGERWAN